MFHKRNGQEWPHPINVSPSTGTLVPTLIGDSPMDIRYIWCGNLWPLMVRASSRNLGSGQQARNQIKNYFAPATLVQRADCLDKKGLFLSLACSTLIKEGGMGAVTLDRSRRNPCWKISASGNYYAEAGRSEFSHFVVFASLKGGSNHANWFFKMRWSIPSCPKWVHESLGVRKRIKLSETTKVKQLGPWQNYIN